MGASHLRLALLICDTPIPSVRERYGTYLDIFRSFLQNALSANIKDSPTSQAVDFTLEGFNVIEGEYPKPEDFVGPDAFNGILITGSSFTAHDPIEWIANLANYVAKVIKEAPQVKIIGICFGHQIVARACGGTLERNPSGWEVGTTQIELNEAGKRVFGIESGRLDIIEMHRDHVTSLPPSFELLGSSPVAPNQGMALRYRSGDVDNLSSNNIHVLTVQGHPEFNPDIVSKMVDAREASGVLDAETVKAGREKGVLRDDGTGPIGRTIWRVLGVDEL